MDTKQVEKAKAAFLERAVGFVSFVEPGEVFESGELEYKHEAVAEAERLLGPYVRRETELATDDEARKFVNRLIDLTNFFNWRDRQYITTEIMADEGAWLAFMNRVLSCLRQLPHGAWQPEFERVLAWLSERRCKANVSKLLPTYFLFLYDPDNHFSMKPSVWDRFLQDVGEAKLGHGIPLTLASYEHALAVCRALREGPLAEWLPRDNIDIHSFAWLVGGGWGPAPRSQTNHDYDAGAQGPPSARLDAGLNVILAGPPGTGKTYHMLGRYREAFADAEGNRFEIVTFHQSYAYEDFVEGIHPVLDPSGTAQVSYRVQDGIFKHLVTRACADPTHTYALFVDEINRANVSNVFGELITLIEPDKRMTYDPARKEWTGGVRVRLPYTHSAHPDAPLFGVPGNLYLIATMNTADRSIALMDLALRRRFRFVEIAPDPTLLSTRPGPIDGGDGAVIHLDRMLERMNQRIEYLLDRDHAIGHSYLMRVAGFADLEAVFRNELLPLLQEYFYGEWEKIQIVLGDLVDDRDRDGGPKAHPDAIVGHLVLEPGDLLGVRDDAYQSRRSYAVSDELTARSFRKIYESA